MWLPENCKACPLHNFETEPRHLFRQMAMLLPEFISLGLQSLGRSRLPCQVGIQAGDVLAQRCQRGGLFCAGLGLLFVDLLQACELMSLLIKPEQSLLQGARPLVGA